MEFDNDKRASRPKMLLITVPFVLLLCTSVPALFLLINTWIPALISAGLMILGWAATVVLKLKNVKFRFAPDQVSVLYYPITPMTSSYKRIDIAAGRLSGYEIATGWGGLRKDLVLHEKIGGEDASYPPVSVLLCSRETLRLLRESLDAYLPSGTSS